VAVTRRVVTRCRIYASVMDGLVHVPTRAWCTAFRPQFFHDPICKLCRILLMGPPNPPAIGALSVSHHFQMGFWNDLVCLGLPETTSVQKKTFSDKNFQETVLK
jgi:hypothetical protein